MARKPAISDPLVASDDFIERFYRNLANIDDSLTLLIDFRLNIQRENLMSLVQEAEERIQRYEHIYPYIKELCHNQTINPSWYNGIEKVLNWALAKGRGKDERLSRDIKNAWITYIVLLSCSMIDKNGNSLVDNTKFQFGKGKGFIGITGSN